MLENKCEHVRGGGIKEIKDASRCCSPWSGRRRCRAAKREGRRRRAVVEVEREGRFGDLAGHGKKSGTLCDEAFGRERAKRTAQQQGFSLALASLLQAFGTTAAHCYAIALTARPPLRSAARGLQNKMVFAEKKTAAAATTYKADDPVAKLIATAEGNLISTTPGAVPPHLDDGGHLPFGGIDGGTRGRSAFGKRKMTRENAIGNPQALLLNYAPEETAATLAMWARNCAFARCARTLSPRNKNSR